MHHQAVIIPFCIIILNVYAVQYEGEKCVKDNLSGVCVNLKNCPSALKDLQNRIRPQICSYDNADSIVCCLDNLPATTSPPQVLTTASSSPPTSTEELALEYTYITGSRDRCEPIPPSLTSPKTGQKAWDKCIEYQEQLVYPCVNSDGLTGGKMRLNRCGHNADELIIGGPDAGFNEFPHMAALGYGSDVAALKWHCGGSLISDRFVLTAGYCKSHRFDGPVTYVSLGIHRRSDIANVTKRYKVKNIIQHPSYQPPSKYNDIALLELDRLVELDQFTVPACLHVGDPAISDRAIATGWDLAQYSKNASFDGLQKVFLTKLTTPECSNKYVPTRRMRQGIDEASQMCYEDRQMSRDMCQGDSGGPLQIRSKNMYCMYVILGVTSYPSACRERPGIYTRVVKYVPWIESVVWP